MMSLFNCTKTGIGADTMQELIENLQKEILYLRSELMRGNKEYLMREEKED